MRKVGNWFLLFVLALATFGLTGCSSTEETANASERPWSTPRGWEGGLPSSMYDRNR